jgi:hypothetical protein
MGLHGGHQEPPGRPEWSGLVSPRQEPGWSGLMSPQGQLDPQEGQWALTTLRGFWRTGLRSRPPLSEEQQVYGHGELPADAEVSSLRRMATSMPSAGMDPRDYGRMQEPHDALQGVSQHAQGITRKGA